MGWFLVVNGLWFHQTWAGKFPWLSYRGFPLGKSSEIHMFAVSRSISTYFLLISLTHTHTRTYHICHMYIYIYTYFFLSLFIYISLHSSVSSMFSLPITPTGCKWCPRWPSVPSPWLGSARGRARTCLGINGLWLGKSTRTRGFIEIYRGFGWFSMSFFRNGDFKRRLSIVSGC